MESEQGTFILRLRSADFSTVPVNFYKFGTHVFQQ